MNGQGRLRSETHYYNTLYLEWRGRDGGVHEENISCGVSKHGTLVIKAAGTSSVSSGGLICLIDCRMPNIKGSPRSHDPTVVIIHKIDEPQLPLGGFVSSNRDNDVLSCLSLQWNARDVK